MDEKCVEVAGTMEALLGGEEVYHYHSKLMMKEVTENIPLNNKDLECQT